MSSLLHDVMLSVFGAAVVAFPYMAIRGAIDSNSRKDNKLIRKAIERGHVVTAHLAREYVDSEPGTEGRYGGLYQYEWNGRTYKKRLFSNDRLSYEVTLYFVSNPRHANTKMGLKSGRHSAVCLFVILFLILFLIFRLDL